MSPTKAHPRKCSSAEASIAAPAAATAAASTTTAASTAADALPSTDAPPPPRATAAAPSSSGSGSPVAAGDPIKRVMRLDAPTRHATHPGSGAAKGAAVFLRQRCRIRANTHTSYNTHKQSPQPLPFGHVCNPPSQLSKVPALRLASMARVGSKLKL